MAQERRKPALKIDYLGLDAESTKHSLANRLEFSAGKARVLVCCHGGISRSAATAYAIKCKECGNPVEAIRILTPVRHHPNRLVVSHAAEILEDKLVYNVYNEWLQKPVLHG